MKYAYFLGCNIPVRIEQYARATEAVLGHLGVELEILDEFNCCGYPVRNVDEKSYVIPSVRNMALAEKAGLDILVLCNCCFASLMKARKVMAEDAPLLSEINTLLAKEGLHYSGTVEIHHFLKVLHTDIGLERISMQIERVYKELNIAPLYGCHLLRPREVTGFDDSFVPKILEELVEITGATHLDWQGKLECCGAALAGLNDEVMGRLLDEKIDGAQQAGAAYVTPVCSYCHLQLDTMQQAIHPERNHEELLSVLLYPQLLGLCMGIDAKTLGIEENSTMEDVDVAALSDLLIDPSEKKKKRRRKKSVPA